MWVCARKYAYDATPGKYHSLTATGGTTFPFQRKLLAHFLSPSHHRIFGARDFWEDCLPPQPILALKGLCTLAMSVKCRSHSTDIAVTWL